MPIYEYICEQCCNSIEKLQKISDEPLKICPNCQQSTLQKKISVAGFILKGNGWYVTDFKNKSDSSKNKPVEKTEKTDTTASTSTENSN